MDRLNLPLSRVMISGILPGSETVAVTFRYIAIGRDETIREPNICIKGSDDQVTWHVVARYPLFRVRDD